MIVAGSPRKVRRITLQNNGEPLDLTPLQERIVFEPARYKLWRGGRRCGKTTAALVWMLKLAEKANSIVWMVGPSYKQIKNIAWRSLFTMLPRSAIKSKNETDLEVILSNNSILTLKGSDSEDSLRGPREGLDGVVIEEAAFQRAYIFEEILRPQLADKRAPALFISTPKGKNWFWKMEQKAVEMTAKGDVKWLAVHSTIYDNPVISREEIEEIKATTSLIAWQQEYMAEYDSAEGMVYPELDESLHVIPPLSKEVVEKLKSDGTPVYRGFDWGMRNPTACLWAYVDNVSGKSIIRCFKEHYRSEMTVPQHAQIMKGMSEGLNIRATFCDPTMRNRGYNGGSTFSDFARFGISMTPAVNRVDEGIEMVKRFLREGRLTFTADMSNTLSEFKTYEYEDLLAYDDANLKEKPRKARDHAMDALKYLVVSMNRTMRIVADRPKEKTWDPREARLTIADPTSFDLDPLAGYIA